MDRIGFTVSFLRNIKKLLILSSFMLIATKVSAIDKTNIIQHSFSIEEFRKATQNMDFSYKPRLLPKPWSVGYALTQGEIKEKTWYWLTPPRFKGSPPLKTDPAYSRNDLIMKRDLYEDFHATTSPVQFVKVGNDFFPKYLLYIELTYTTPSIEQFDPQKIKNLSQYLSLLNKENSIFINASSGKVISRNETSFCTHYFNIQKKDMNIKVSEIKKVLYKAEIYSYYSTKYLKTKSTYIYHKNDKRLIVITDTYKDDYKNGLLNKGKPLFVPIKDIQNQELRQLFLENL